MSLTEREIGPYTITREIGRGGMEVEAAYEAGVIHRDRKPGNVIVTPEAKSKVLDFGLPRAGCAAPGEHGAPRIVPVRGGRRQRVFQFAPPPGGVGKADIYRAQRLPDGTFAEPINLGPSISTDQSEGDTYVAPDES